MADNKNFYKGFSIDGLKNRINQLEKTEESNRLELGLIENELRDTLNPNILLMQLNQYVLQMLMEVQEFRIKNKTSQRGKEAQERLSKILGITCQLSGLGDANQSLKLYNRDLLGAIQLLKIENSSLKKKLENVNKAFDGF